MLTSKQRLAIFLHIGGYSNTELSAQIGVHPSTIRRWMREPEFARELQTESDHAMARARAQAQSAARRIADNACAAARATQTLLLSDRTDPRVVVQCARLMLQSLEKLREILSEPAVVPLLESDDPALENESKTAPLLCDTLRDEELATNQMLLRKLEEDARESQAPQPACKFNAPLEHRTSTAKPASASAAT